LNIKNIDTSNVVDMSYMFDSCFALEDLDVANFKTSKVKDMSYMFQYCLSMDS